MTKDAGKAAAWRRGDVVAVTRIAPFTAVETEIGPLKIMAIADGYAMVRRPNGAPFAEQVKDLHAPTVAVD